MFDTWLELQFWEEKKEKKWIFSWIHESSRLLLAIMFDQAAPCNGWIGFTLLPWLIWLFYKFAANPFPLNMPSVFIHVCFCIKIEDLPNTHLCMHVKLFRSVMWISPKTEIRKAKLGWKYKRINPDSIVHKDTRFLEVQKFKREDIYLLLLIF